MSANELASISVDSKSGNKWIRAFRICVPYLAILSMLAIFILFRWHIIDLVWAGRLTPPEPDDSFGYITHVRMIGDTGSFFYDLKHIFPWNHADHLRYPIWSATLAIVKMISNSVYVDVYKANFYFGIVLLAFIILHMLKVLEKDKLFWAFAILFLALYYGSGLYHGFYWVVPSFYSLAATLLLISLVFGMEGRNDVPKKRWFGLFFLITFLTIWSHPLGKFSYIATVFSFFVYVILKKVLHLGNSTTNLLRKAIVIIASGVIVIFSLEVLPYLIGTIPPRLYSLAGVVQQTGAVPSSFDIFSKLYLDYFSFSSYGMVLLGIGLFAVLVRKRISLFSLYFCFFTLSLVSSFFSELGYRMLMYLWPLTLLIYSYGCYFLVREFINLYEAVSTKKLKANPRKDRWSIGFQLNKDFVLFAFVIVLVATNCIYPFTKESYDRNFRSADNNNKRMIDWKVDVLIVDFFTNVTNHGDLIVFADTNAFFTVASLGLLNREVAYADWDWSGHYAFLQKKVNGSYLVATGTPKIENVINLTKAFGEKITFYFVRNFGILSVYHIIIGQTEVVYLFAYTEIDVELLAGDFQTSFWSKTRNIHVVDDNETKVSGDNALKNTLSQTEESQNDFIYHTYDTSQDWSDKDFLIFDWYGAGSGKRIEILIYAPDGSNRFDFVFKDDFAGWNLMLIPLNSFMVRRGNPSWSSVETMFFRFNLDSPYTETFYLDRLLLDVAPEEEVADVKLISDDFQTSTQILLSFFFLLLAPGLTWAFFVFRVRGWFALIAISFGLSLSLVFLAMFLLNVAFGFTISKASSIITVAVITVLPPAVHYFRKIMRVVRDF